MTGESRSPVQPMAGKRQARLLMGAMRSLAGERRKAPERTGATYHRGGRVLRAPSIGYAERHSGRVQILASIGAAERCAKYRSGSTS